MNSVKLVGMLVQDVGVFYTPAGLAVVNFSLLVENNDSKHNFIPVIARGKIAEECKQYLKKGNKIFVEGKLQSRDYNTVDGERKTILEVMAENIARRY